MAESPLARLVGTWEFEPLVEGRSVGRGRATFEWIEDGAFILERSDGRVDRSRMGRERPGTTHAVIGFDDTTDEVIQLYADDRGVFRVYRGTLTDKEWRLQRAAPDFHQRFVGVFGDGGAHDRRPMGVVARRGGLGAGLPDHLSQARPMTSIAWPSPIEPDGQTTSEENTNDDRHRDRRPGRWKRPEPP